MRVNIQSDILDTLIFLDKFCDFQKRFEEFLTLQYYCRQCTK